MRGGQGERSLSDPSEATESDDKCWCRERSPPVDLSQFTRTPGEISGHGWQGADAWSLRVGMRLMPEAAIPKTHEQDGHPPVRSVGHGSASYREGSINLAVC